MLSLIDKYEYRTLLVKKLGLEVPIKTKTEAEAEAEAENLSMLGMNCRKIIDMLISC